MESDQWGRKGCPSTTQPSPRWCRTHLLQASEAAMSSVNQPHLSCSPWPAQTTCQVPRAQVGLLRAACHGRGFKEVYRRCAVNKEEKRREGEEKEER